MLGLLLWVRVLSCGMVGGGDFSEAGSCFDYCCGSVVLFASCSTGDCGFTIECGSAAGDGRLCIVLCGSGEVGGDIPVVQSTGAKLGLCVPGVIVELLSAELHGAFIVSGSSFGVGIGFMRRHGNFYVVCGVSVRWNRT